MQAAPHGERAVVQVDVGPPQGEGFGLSLRDGQGNGSSGGIAVRLGGGHHLLASGALREPPAGEHPVFPVRSSRLTLNLASREALSILTLALSLEAGPRLSLSKIAAALRRAGRQRGIEAPAERIQAALRAPRLQANPGVAKRLCRRGGLADAGWLADAPVGARGVSL